MSAISLDGAALLAKVKAELAAEVEDLRSRGVTPGLGTILVGDNPSSAAYVRLKHQDCAELGITSVGEHLPADAGQDEVLATIERFNADDRVDAFLVQVPLPKDVDGLHPVNLGRLVMGSPGPIPCTPAGILELLVHHGVPIEGRHVVIIGRGLTIGRPLALLLSLKRPNCNAAVTVVHTGVADLADHTRRADILIVAAGAPGLVTPDMVKPGAAVVGAGVTMDGRRIISDVVDEVAEVAGWMTPRVGGVGPMTRAGLLRNCVRAAKRRA